jgi:hypothetical protein
MAVRPEVAEFNALNAGVRTARETGDHVALLQNVRKLAALAPGHPGLQVGLARALAENRDGAGAVAQLNRVADLGFSFAASADAAFAGLKDEPNFIAAAQRLSDNAKGLGRGSSALPRGAKGLLGRKQASRS